MVLTLVNTMSMKRCPACHHKIIEPVYEVRENQDHNYYGVIKCFHCDYILKIERKDGKTLDS